MQKQIGIGEVVEIVRSLLEKVVENLRDLFDFRGTERLFQRVQIQNCLLYTSRCV